MKQKVLQFAKNYRRSVEKQSERVMTRSPHPVLYAFVGDCGDAVDGICGNVRDLGREGIRVRADKGVRANTEGTFHVRLFAEATDRYDVTSARTAVRAVKTAIQRNEDQLNIKRVTIFVIAQAVADVTIVTDATSATDATAAAEEETGTVTTATTADLLETAGTLLRDIFTEDFPIVHMTLFILLSESNRYADYERRAAQSYQTLRGVEALQHTHALFERVFILSDRYENDVVSEENMNNNYAIINRLRTLSHEDSRFEESLRKKSIDTGTAFFITAGMARLEKPTEAIAFAVFKHVFSYLLETLKISGEASPFLSMETLLPLLPLSPLPNPPVSEAQLTHDLLGVAARDVGIAQLRGKSLREAENLLFGENAARFFEMNYGSRHFYQGTDAPQMIRWFLEQSPTGLYQAATYQEALSDTDEKKRMLDAQIAQYEREAEQLYRETVRGPGLFLKKDAIKRMIAAVYIIRYKAEGLRATKAALTALSEGMGAYARYARRLIKGLETAAASLAQEPDPGHHITAYYKQVVDTILAELAGRYGPSFLLEEGFIGPVSTFDANAEKGNAEKNNAEKGNVDKGNAEKSGAEPDLSPLAEKIGAFIQTHIFTHEAMNLSFSEDLTRRADLTPDGYDGTFLPIDAFYRRVTAEAEGQAALAVSLQRYDDLIREKYYCGDTDSMLMRYIRQANRDNGGEPAYYLPDASAFWVVRLAGGFTLDNLTRYRVMHDAYDRMIGGC